MNLPLTISEKLILKEIKGDKLEISTLTSNGKNEKFICQRDVEPFKNYIGEKSLKAYKNSINDMIGTYSGDFGESKITLVIESINQHTFEVTGLNTVNVTSRILSGSVDILEDHSHFILEEPGDDEFDGVFDFIIDNKSSNVLYGTWRANKKALVREFRLLKK